MTMAGKVVFIGAGPGDPELLTCKGKRLIDQADIIIWAGSLVNEAVLAGRKPAARVYNSAEMTLDQLIAVMEAGVAENALVARVHTGDPAIYGAMQEQIARLAERGIDYEIVPGVSSFLGAAAALGRELTLPGVSQTVILTRQAGRTPVPEGQRIADLARHRASMVLFLSSGLLEETVRDLLTGYPPDTPAAVVYKATWPDQKVVQGTLADLAEQVRAAGIEKTALIFVGDFLREEFEPSCLYSAGFTHEYRGAKGDNGE